MPSSDLHKRLDHLISYSSQLIFINTGPQASGQSQITDKLLAQQSESADVAVINVLPAMQADEFRQQLGQQLLGGQSHHANQPIQQLLSPLSQFTESVLICILHAQNLPEMVLQECWQLVLMHNKKLSEQNINILLFADDNWTEAAKDRLPIDGTNRPVVLNIANTDSVTQDSELEQLISQKRQAFAQRIKTRDASPELVATSVLHKPWFWAVTGLLFVSIFAALLLIQYPQFPAKIMALMDDTVASSTNPAPISESSPASPVNIEADLPVQSPGDIEGNDDNGAIVSGVSNGDALVSSWKSETARIDQAKAVRQQGDIGIPDDPGLQAKEVASGVATAADNQTRVQVGALPKSFAEQILPNERGIEPTVPPTNLSGPYRYNEQALLALTPDGYVLQVIGLGSPQAMENYIQTNQLSTRVWIYKTRRYGNDWYVLLNNNYYPSLGGAVEAVDSLPKSMRQTSPFPKSVEKVQQEIRNP
ncbi:MAG: DamX protein [Paraglaciecola sp.]